MRTRRSSVRRSIGTTIGAIAIVALTVAACGGGSKASGSKASGSSGSTSAGAGSTSGAASASLPSAPVNLTALPLLKGVNLGAALGSAVIGYQDDGGYPAIYPNVSFISQAETATNLTRLVVTLQTFGSTGDAATAYQQATKAAAPLTGLGDMAAYTTGVPLTVLKGSQVLTVSPNATSAGNDYIAEQDKSTESIASIYDKPALAAAAAIAPKLTGTSVSKQYVQIAEGGVDPCVLSTTTLAKDLATTVTATYGKSETAPRMQCTYAVGTRRYLLQTYTSTQASNAIPATTVQAQFTADMQKATRGQQQKVTTNSFSAFMNVDTDWQFEFLVSSTGSVSGLVAHGIAEPALQELIRIRNAVTGPLTRDQCYKLGEDAFGRLSLATPDADVTKFTDTLVDWCSGFPKS
jgi:hypothetical protein